MAASSKSSSSAASSSNIQWKFSANKRATDDESSSSQSKRQKSSSASASGSNSLWKYDEFLNFRGEDTRNSFTNESSSSQSKRQKSSSASASGSNSRWQYDVFLSFRGEYTRNNFTDHLNIALKRKGIYAFGGDERLDKGKEISLELLEAIEESRFSIVILSENYASSTWCLDELSKIVECMGSYDHTVYPVFYKVDPSDVRKQTGDFKKAFDNHEVDYKDNPEKVKRWRAALKRVAEIAGWDLKYRSEADLIEDIVCDISRRLIDLRPTVVGDQLVGIESRVEEIYKLLELELDDRVTFVGIWGMGGIGKTTIASVVYERLSSKYEGSCFLANVREIYSRKRGSVHLQEMLLSKTLKETNLNICDGYEGISLIRRRLCKKKVFLVLDDVDQLEQLDQLVGRNDWFGSGSRIIITTRDEHVLVNHGIKNRYKVQEFNNDDAQSLFRLKAFKNIQQTMDYVELSKDAICLAGGLPLALVVLGSFLCGKSVNEWIDVMNRLKKYSNEMNRQEEYSNEMSRQEEYSNEMNRQEEYSNENILKVLRFSYDGLGEMERKIFLDIACFFKWKDTDRTMEILNCCYFYPDIELLVERSLITIIDKKLYMHDLIQEMGWEIVREQHPKEPGKWSRLWVCKNVYQVLAENMGTPSVEAIIPDSDRHREEISRLKLNDKSFSAMRNLRLLIINDVDVDLSEDLEYLSNQLRFLEWRGYPLKSLPTSFQPRELVKLSLCYSRIEYLWKDIKPSMNCLKTINLSFSRNLIKTPDFEMIPNLERLDLQFCTKLREVHQSVGFLGRLIVLNLNKCQSLVLFPNSVSGLKSLKDLNLNGCSNLVRFPSNFSGLKSLEVLNLNGCSNLVRFPSNVSGMKSLKILNLNGCSKLDTLPLTLGEVEQLEELDVSGTAIGQVPSSIVQLKNLKTLSLSGCNVGSPETWSFSLTSCLMLSDCMGLMLPTRKSGCMGLMLPPLAGLSSLITLDLSDCNLLEIPSDIGSLFSLRELRLGGNNFVSLPDSITQLSSLHDLSLEKCQRLQSVPKLPPKIKFVAADDCTSLKTISSLELTSQDIELQFFNCFELTQGRNRSLAIMLLQRWLQIIAISNPDTMLSSCPQFHIRLPGSEIPELFSYWSEGSTITWPLPHCLLNDELIGFCVCAVMSLPDRSYDVVIACDIEGLEVRCNPRSDSMGADHLWLAYFSKNNLYPKDACGKGVTASFKIRDFKSRKQYNNLVKRCGIRPVYKECLKELSATDGAITMLHMPSKLQGSRFRKCINCNIADQGEDVNLTFSFNNMTLEDSSVE